MLAGRRPSGPRDNLTLFALESVDVRRSESRFACRPERLDCRSEPPEQQIVSSRKEHGGSPGIYERLPVIAQRNEPSVNQWEGCDV